MDRLIMLIWAERIVIKPLYAYVFSIIQKQPGKNNPKLFPRRNFVLIGRKGPAPPGVPLSNLHDFRHLSPAGALDFPAPVH